MPAIFNIAPTNSLSSGIGGMFSGKVCCSSLASTIAQGEFARLLNWTALWGIVREYDALGSILGPFYLGNLPSRGLQWGRAGGT